MPFLVSCVLCELGQTGEEVRGTPTLSSGKEAFPDQATLGQTRFARRASAMEKEDRSARVSRGFQRRLRRD